MGRGDFSTESMLIPASSVGGLDGEAPHPDNQVKARRRLPRSPDGDNGNVAEEAASEADHKIDRLA